MYLISSLRALGGGCADAAPEVAPTLPRAFFLAPKLLKTKRERFDLSIVWGFVRRRNEKESFISPGFISTSVRILEGYVIRYFGFSEWLGKISTRAGKRERATAGC